MALSKIQAESMNLADTYAFTGTVSGAGETNDMKLLSSVDAGSGTSAIIFDSSVVDSSTYKHFYIVGHRLFSSSNNDNLRFYQSHNNGSTFNNDNKRGQVYMNLYSGSSFGHEQATTSSSGYAHLGGSISDSSAGGSMNIWVNGAGYSTWKYINYIFTSRHGGGEAYSWHGSFEQQNSNAYNYFKFQMATGNIYGYYSLYGVKQ